MSDRIGGYLFAVSGIATLIYWHILKFEDLRFLFAGLQFAVGYLYLTKREK